jgi:formylglycine-generating enzyme required for sulfatase activity/tRNA A-37 threonylcarbamoyl transferase component Bud32
MGVVWAARHLALETDVAVKLIRAERVAADPTLVARFEREARTTARITHPHVVQVMDYGTVDDTPYIVMELLEGFSLADLLERGGRLSLQSARSLVRQVGSALECAHQRGVVHRDIKPHNVFITGRASSPELPLFVKVLDFGIAKIMGEAQVSAASHTLTETGVVIGSAPYMSPEQLEGSRHVDLRSDLWSLAVIVYETLTGCRPFQGNSFVSVGAAVLKGRYRPASELRPDLPEGIDDWFAKALCLDPIGRFQSARQMVDALVRHEAAHGDADGVGNVLAVDAGVSAFATTEALAIASAPEGAPSSPGTAVHAPRAKRPAAKPAASRWRGFVLLAAAACAAGAGAFGISARARTAGSARCPEGMKRIEGTTFRMGSADDGETPSDETPLHGVTLPTFCIDATEVTVEAYEACRSCERAPATVELEGLTPNGRSFWSQFCAGVAKPSRDHPVTCVDWHQAKAYCASVGKRLPSEAEWELTARGNDARAYPWGNAPPSGQRVNACGAECSRMLSERLEKIGKGPWPRMHGDDDAAPSTAAVGRYPAGATAAGVLDLAGNVWEWTEDRYCPYGKGGCDDSRRVLRGGGWDTVESQYVRAAHRRPSAPSARGWSIGFRCAKTP